MPSSVVAAMHYDEARAVLRIIYTSGAVYDYMDVPVQVYQEMKTAASKGIYLNLHIKGAYEFKKIK